MRNTQALQADLVVGADGIHSQVRRDLSVTTSPATWATARTAW